MKNILFFLSLFSLILPLKVFPCPTAFRTENGSSMVRNFMSGKKEDLQRAVDLIGVYNPNLDAQLKREGYSRDGYPRELFQKDIDLNNQSLWFLQNFYSGNVSGKNSFFVGEVQTYSPQSSVPVVGRIVRRTGRKIAVVEVINLTGDIKKMEVEVEASFHFDYYNEGTKDKFGDGFKVFVKNDEFSIMVRQGNPQLEMVFAALQSNKKTFDYRLSDTSISNEEQKLKAQGFNSAYIRGINEVNEWIAVVDQMRKLKINPYKTHIDYLADKVRDHIAHVREGLSSSHLREMRNLERLEELAERTIQEEGVTYLWWLRFNYALSRIYDHGDITVRGRFPRVRSIDERLLVNLFPAQVVMPTIIEKMGVMAANRANRNNIHPVVLLKQEEETKGLTGIETVSPTWVFNESVRDAIKIINMSNTFLVEHYGPVYGRWWREMENLPVEERQGAEIALFSLTQLRLPFVKEDLWRIRSELHGFLDSRITYNPSFNVLREISSEYLKDEWVKEIIESFEGLFFRVEYPPHPRFTLL